MSHIALKRLGVPALVFLLLLIQTLYWDVLLFRLSSDMVKRALWVGRYVFGICLWLTLAWFTIRVLNELVWPLIFEQRLGYAVPRLLKDFIHVIILAIAIGTIISVVFEQSLTGFLAASGVLGFVLGLALRSLIADFFSGISLNLERSFALGDRIRLESGEQGEVIEINWRTTIIGTLMGNQITIPNSRISSMRVENYDKPTKTTRQYLEFHLGFDVPTERALRILQAAATQAQAVIDDHSTANVLCQDITEHGVRYRIIFHVPQYPFMRARSEVVRSVLHHLAVAGLRPVYLTQDIALTDNPVRLLDPLEHPHTLLQKTALFSALDASEVAVLATRMRVALFPAGEVIVQQGDHGSSMYIVAEGLLHVYIHQADAGEPIRVGQLAARAFFGEISLLTGDPRTATVKAAVDSYVYEITREDMQALLDKRPEIAAGLTQVVARYRLRDAARTQQLTPAEHAVEVESLATQLLHKMRSFFTMFRRSAE